MICMNYTYKTTNRTRPAPVGFQWADLWEFGFSYEQALISIPGVRRVSKVDLEGDLKCALLVYKVCGGLGCFIVCNDE